MTEWGSKKCMTKKGPETHTKTALKTKRSNAQKIFSLPLRNINENIWVMYSTNLKCRNVECRFGCDIRRECFKKWKNFIKEIFDI